MEGRRQTLGTSKQVGSLNVRKINQENAAKNQDLRPLAKRPVLSTLTNNKTTTTIRIQPANNLSKTLAASKVDSENIRPDGKAFGSKTGKGSFKVFEDVYTDLKPLLPKVHDKAKPLSTVATKPLQAEEAPRAPLVSLDISKFIDEDDDSNKSSYSLTESPMLLDSSHLVNEPANKAIRGIKSKQQDSDGFFRLDCSAMSGIEDDSLVLDLSGRDLVVGGFPHKEEDCYLTLLSEYTDDIYAYLLDLEKRFRPKLTFMKKQPDITLEMRRILVDWLVEVAEEYTLQTETLHLCVAYVDRFLSQMSVLRQKLQLVGTTALFLSSKYEEIYPPEVTEFVYITDDTYTKKQVLRMEKVILNVLNFDLSSPTIFYFIRLYGALLRLDKKVQFLAMYLSELSLLDIEPYVEYAPSMIASSCICLANCTLNLQKPWTTAMREVTGYRIEDLSRCSADLLKTFVAAPEFTQQAIRDKYKNDKYSCVSLLMPPRSLPY